MTFPYRAFLPLAALAGLAACAGTPDPAHDPVGVWTGALATDEGTCPTSQVSTLVIGQRSISFAPGSGSLVLKGQRGADPLKFHAELALTDANHHPYPMVFNAVPVGQAIGGMYGTPSCRAHVTLTRTTD